MRLDREFHDRAFQLRLEREKARLLRLLMPRGWDAKKPRGARRAFEAKVESLWLEARATGAFHDAGSHSHFVLVMLTRPRWEASEAHRAFAARMIGTTERDWSLEEGIRSVFAHVVLPHYLRPDLAQAFAPGDGFER